ncbi:ZIP family metal transporter [Botrimarina sp.]|uniref:ZIP family metal transporter n=1 Tax=Botrimarina sp. TaxID=2795802 RepID=UPI0032EBAFF7
MDTVLLTYYCVAIVAVSVAGGLLPRWLPMTHRRTELVVSFVAGTMLGVAALHLLPHALATAGPDSASPARVMRWVLGGFLAMFLIERFFCFHHHDLEDSDQAETHEPSASHGCGHDHSHSEHSLSWSGAAMGLTLHSLLAGVALAASVRHAPDGAWIAGLGAFVAIVLHKPLDAMTITVLMRHGGWSAGAQAVANALFAAAVPLGVALYHLGVAPPGEGGPSFAAGLAFSAGVFLCVAMSDLLPELQFHDHDRVALSLALVAGLAVAEVAGRLETHNHAAAAGGAPQNSVAPAEGGDSAAQPDERNAS